jgi:hypothetical protein
MRRALVIELGDPAALNAGGILADDMGLGKRPFFVKWEALG